MWSELDLEASGLPLHDVAQRLRRVELRHQALVIPGFVGAAAESCRHVCERRWVQCCHAVDEERDYLQEIRASEQPIMDFLWAQRTGCEARPFRRVTHLPSFLLAALLVESTGNSFDFRL